VQNNITFIIVAPFSSFVYKLIRVAGMGVGCTRVGARMRCPHIRTEENGGPVHLPNLCYIINIPSLNSTFHKWDGTEDGWWHSPLQLFLSFFERWSIIGHH